MLVAVRDEMRASFSAAGRRPGQTHWPVATDCIRTCRGNDDETEA